MCFFCGIQGWSEMFNNEFIRFLAHENIGVDTNNAILD